MWHPPSHTSLKVQGRTSLVPAGSSALLIARVTVPVAVHSPGGSGMFGSGTLPGRIGGLVAVEPMVPQPAPPTSTSTASVAPIPLTRLTDTFADRHLVFKSEDQVPGQDEEQQLGSGMAALA